VQPPSQTQVQLFVTCLVDSLYPAVGQAVVEVLERLGCEVVIPAGQICCGQPAYNGGFGAEARRVARRWLDVFERSPAPIVVPSGSCAAMIVHGYPELFRTDPHALARAQALAARTYEFSQFLVDVLQVDPARLDLPACAARLTYHPSCHLSRGLGLRGRAEALLQAVPGAEWVPLPGAEDCCGFGGLFAVKHADVSAAMLDKKLANVRATGAEALVACDMSCLMHMQGGLLRDGSPIRCLHLAQVLAGPREQARP
jgi:L-lactate dehydrogenase complex protein LldE